MRVDSIKQKWVVFVAWLMKLSSEPDNRTPCPVRIGTLGVAMAYHVGVAWMVFSQGDHVTQVGLGLYVQHMCYLIGFGAGGVGIKSVLGGDAK